MYKLGGCIVVKSVITRDGNKYVYVGDIPNIPTVRKSERDFCKEQGRKVVFVTDPNNA